MFDKIIFIHGGRVIFDGAPDHAYQHFQVESLDQVYVRLAEEGRTGDEWAQDFKSTGPERPSADEVPREPDISLLDEIPQARRFRPGFFRSLKILIERQWSILAADKLNVLFLLAQPVLIAMLVGWVAEDYVLRMFLCVVATLWFGCSNGAQQIIKELPIFRRERICGLGLNAYLFSKYLFLGAITGSPGFPLADHRPNHVACRSAGKAELRENSTQSFSRPPRQEASFHCRRVRKRVSRLSTGMRTAPSRAQLLCRRPRQERESRAT